MPPAPRPSKLARLTRPLFGALLDAALKDAIERWRPRKAKAMLALGANCEGESYPGIPFLCRTARLGSLQILEALLARGANPLTPGASKWLPIHFAALKDHHAAIDILARFGSPIEPVVDPGWSPLTLAVQSNRAEAIEALCALGADPDFLDEKKQTALQLSCRKGFDDAARVLLKHGASVVTRDSRGFTPLHLAAAGGFMGICEMLLESGADPLAPGPWSKTPLDSARNEGFSPVFALLEKAALLADPELRAKADGPPRRQSGRL